MPQMRASHWFLGWFLAAALLFPQATHAATYLITVIDARIAPHKANKRRWDGGFGKMTLPDVFVQLEIGGKRFKTLVAPNTLYPSWKTSWTIQSHGKERLYIKVMDKDLTDNDLIGEGDVMLEKVPAKLFFGQVLALRITVEKMPEPKKAHPVLPPPPRVPRRVEPPKAPKKQVEPAKPAKPAKQVEPAKPTKQVEPAKPAKPAKQVEPAKPAKQVEPAKPAKPAKQAAPPKATVTPKPPVAPKAPTSRPVAPPTSRKTK
ncbi:MAG: hypothetical protein H6728_09165 [Myxococcales bacterium]|nr:hypothetical protein [Myxococcales bacterium]MCB9643233.1 hypothetical protein [Myxococcales bacterium]